MAWMYYNGKRRKIIDYLYNEHSDTMKNLTLYLEGDEPKTVYVTSALTLGKGVKIDADIQKHNDNVFRAWNIYKKEQKMLIDNQKSKLDYYKTRVNDMSLTAGQRRFAEKRSKELELLMYQNRQKKRKKLLMR